MQLCDGYRLIFDVSWNPIGTWCFQTSASGCHNRQAMAPHCILEWLPSAANSRLRHVSVYSCKFEKIKKYIESSTDFAVMLCYCQASLSRRELLHFVYVLFM
ncbi:hypothetical protein PAHAL_9G369800 [Panicum hallii]|jgi:hypothetical protein|uniref:Uncharacterized protein n=1 Tax=Panicum hallii TaxID=206008 RepID=A0A2S3INB4_9POAL|nr:hypothetical protein PAHAL_9G369800 [Panicum hallii]